MKKNELQTRERKTVPISIRTTEENSKFMKKENLSPNAIFEKALEELKEVEWRNKISLSGYSPDGGIT